MCILCRLGKPGAVDRHWCGSGCKIRHRREILHRVDYGVWGYVRWAVVGEGLRLHGYSQAFGGQAEVSGFGLTWWAVLLTAGMLGIGIVIGRSHIRGLQNYQLSGWHLAAS